MPFSKERVGIEERILEILESNIEGYMRSELVSELGIPHTTVYDYLLKLQIRGKIIRYTIKLNRRRGRPNTFWKLNRS